MSAAIQPQPHTDTSLIPDQVERLRASFDTGRTRPLAWRREQLEALAAMMRENDDAFVAALHADFGKPALEAFATDVAIVATEADDARKRLAKWTRPERVSSPLNQQPAKARIVREPLGVVLIISPWNYPVQLLLSPLVGALAAGNCVVLKPSEVTAHTSAAARPDIVPRYLDNARPSCSFEGGVDGDHRRSSSERFDHIFYTGNGTVGRIVMEAAAKHLTPVTLELGGKTPCIVATATPTMHRRGAAHRLGEVPERGADLRRPRLRAGPPRPRGRAGREARRHGARSSTGSDPKASERLRPHRERPPLHRRLSRLLEGRRRSWSLGGQTRRSRTATSRPPCCAT